MSNIDKQALREAAEKATPGEWKRMMRNSDELMTTFHGIAIGNVFVELTTGKRDIFDAEFISAANPATVLALLDELEAKDKSISFLKDQLAQLANFNPDWDKLEAATDSLREHMAELTAARKRIAELEAREVNFSLPAELTVEDCDVLARTIEYGTGWNLAISSCEEKFIHALNSAGIRINRED